MWSKVLLEPAEPDPRAFNQIELLQQILPALDHLVVVYPDIALAREDIDVRL